MAKIKGLEHLSLLQRLNSFGLVKKICVSFANALNDMCVGGVPEII